MTPTELQQFLRDKLRKAYNLGQTYWQQADSEYRRENKKADETATKFAELVENVVLAVTFELNRAARTEAAKATGTAGELTPLPDPLEINWPELNSNALGCGVEDRGIRDRYDAAEYGWQDGVDKAIERVPEAIYDADQMREYGQACAAFARGIGHAEGFKSAEAARQPAPVSVSERDMAIAQAVRQACVNSYSPDDSVSDYTEKMGDIDLATIIRAATNRSQP